MKIARPHSEQLFQQALECIPGGLDNPARSFRSVGLKAPVFMRRGSGARLWDEDGNQYTDYVMGWGVHILGHHHPEVDHTITQTTEQGIHFGTPTRAELELAQFLLRAIPSIEQVRLVNSGTEAVMAAVRTAQAFTNKPGIIKFHGCYHGWHEDMLIGSSYKTGIENSNIHLAPFNDLEETRRIVEKNHNSLAGIIVEPVAGNMGVIEPRPGFLDGLRAICDDYGILLIFDEIMTGFRVAFGGAQAKYNVKPDITCLGKIIGGGLPIGAYGGKSPIMAKLVPLGTSAYQGGTYSGNPLSASAGVTVLNILKEDKTYCEKLEQKATTLCSEIERAGRQFGIPVSTVVVGGMFTVYFCKDRPYDYDSVQECDMNAFSKFFRGMLDSGVYWPPSQFEAAHVSLVHSDDDLEFTVRAAHSVFSSW